MRRAGVVLSAGVLGLGLAAPPAAAAEGLPVLQVTTTDDTVDVAPGDGVCVDEAGECSLRAAVMEANATGGLDVVRVPAGEYVLTVGMNEWDRDDDAATGDLDVVRPLALDAEGAVVTTDGFVGLVDVIGTRLVARGLSLRAPRAVDAQLKAQDAVLRLRDVEVRGGAGVVLTASDVAAERFRVIGVDADRAGYGLGALGVRGGRLELRRSEITGNVSLGDMGVVAREAQVRLVDTSIYGNYSNLSGEGSALVVQGGELEMVRGEVGGNRSAIGAGASVSDAEVVLRGTLFAGNYGSAENRGYGGGFTASRSTIAATDVRVESNYAVGSAGGFLLSNSDATFVGGSISRNVARSFGDTVGAGAVVESSRLVLDGVTLASNRAEAGGAALWAAGSTVEMVDVVARENSVNGFGAVLRAVDTSVLTRSSTFAANTSGTERGFERDGGAAFDLRQGSWRDFGSTFSANVAVDGGGAVRLEGTRAFLYETRFEDNEATSREGRGGALLVESGRTSLRDVVTSGNSSAGSAGALAVGEDAVVSVVGGRLAGSAAEGAGGAVLVEGDLLLRGTGLSGNRAATGAGVHVADTGRGRLVDVDLRGNRAEEQGGGVWGATAAQVDVRSSAFGGNGPTDLFRQAPAPGRFLLDGTPVSVGANDA